MARLVNYHPYKWPSGKRAFDYSGQAIGAISKNWKEEYTVPVPAERLAHAEAKALLNPKRKPLALTRRPVVPAGIGATLLWREMDQAKLKNLKIPDHAYSFPKWVFDPTLLSQELQYRYGLL